MPDNETAKPERPLDIADIGPRVAEMWWCLGESAREIAHAALIEGRPHLALEHAELAEACYWRSTGEADCIDVKGGYIRSWPRIEERSVCDHLWESIPGKPGQRCQRCRMTLDELEASEAEVSGSVSDTGGTR